MSRRTPGGNDPKAAVIANGWCSADAGAHEASEFRRAYLNMWPGDGDEGWRLMDRDAWEQAAL